MTNNKLKDDGGPAFSRAAFESDNIIDEGARGMSLRDWVMGQCVARAFAYGLREPIDVREGETSTEARERIWGDILRGAAMAADAMIAERNKI
jgi:hypothetical protein